jgi:hypothetical protein
MIFAVMATAFFSCKKDNDNKQGTARVNFHLTDGPGPYDAVYVDIRQVEVHSDVSGWVTLTPVHPGIYNLLDFSNGSGRYSRRYHLANEADTGQQ